VLFRSTLLQHTKAAQLIVTHRRELVAQNASKLPGHIKGSVFSAGLGQKNLSGQVIYAGIQSIQKQWHKLPKLGSVIIDEPQYAAKGYYEFIENVKKVSPHVRVVGLTATPYTGNGTWLHMLPENRLFTGIAAEVGIGELLYEGHLCPLTPYSSTTRLSTDGIKTDARTGDFQQNQLQAAVDVPELVIQCAAEIESIFADRKSVLVFCTGVKHAEHMAAMLGKSAAVVVASTPMKERDRLIAEFRAGTLKYLCSCEVVLVGFDAVNTDGIACLRPTKSPLIWVQLVGRGMRPHHGKANCLVADFTSNSEDFPPVDEIEGKPPKTGQGDAPVRICDNCFSIILAGLRKCPVCGEEFDFAEHEHEFDPETGLLISGVVKNEDGTRTFPVSSVTYEVRNTRAGSEALVAYYHSPGRKTPVAEEWYNLFHHKRSVVARDTEKWLRRALTPGLPTNAQEALVRAELGGMKVPRTVTIRTGSPFPVRFSA
jgi:DNA repair protein RadD